MEPITTRALRRLVDRAARDGEVLAVILFGSQARGDAGPGSDVDVCLVAAPHLSSREEATRKRLEYLSESDLDLCVFQQLPLHVRRRVLKEGTVLFTRDEDTLYALAARTARAYEYFRPIQRRYLDEVARG
jgi:predicted nucleotidyltransferase